MKKIKKYTISLILLLAFITPNKLLAISQNRIEAFSKLHSSYPFSTNRLNLKNINNGRILIHYWATWCTSCVEEMEEIIPFLEKYSESFDQIYFISLDNNSKLHRKFWKRLKLKKYFLKIQNIYTLFDPDLILGDYGVRLVPESHLYLKGKLIRKVINTAKWQDKKFINFLIGRLK